MNIRKGVLGSALLSTSLALLPAHAADKAATIEELQSSIDSQQQQIEALAQQIEASPAATAGRGETTIGGYGELHYNNLDNRTAGGSDKKEIDFHRFVLFFGHEFSDSVRFFSELEVEHSLIDKTDKGAVELEQAFIDFDLNDRHTARAGLFLLPVGILNETHEPPTFYGVERNPVETNIIPATWWEGGAALYGELAPGLSYDVAVTSGLDNDSYSIRSGRQKVAKAVAENLAYTGRIKWTGVAGLEVAATVQRQDNITQGDDPDASATLLETHAIWNQGPIGVRALYASWKVDGDGAKAAGMDEQTGFYIEPSYKVSSRFGVFARYNQWDNKAGDSTDSEYNQLDLGLNYWPHEDVVVKLDYQNQDVPSGQDEFDGFNLGIGYQF